MNPVTVDPLTLPSLPLANRSALPPCPAVYFALEGDHVLYVGRSVNLKQRWMTHRRYSQLKGFNNVRIAWLECSDSSLLPEIEVALIEYFRPSLNGELIPLPAKNLKGIMTYVRPEVYDKLKLLAEKDERSISNLAAKVLSDWIEERSINNSKTITTDEQHLAASKEA
ncbi:MULTISPECIES: GIY-YIG nuclease family protein [unclassified Microcoleus]|uniref:GIY-YIG nuclease family protein n=1 Tax=unclassified Microcoleus TaxID=2642155 RepID=UPI002FD383CA